MKKEWINVNVEVPPRGQLVLFMVGMDVFMGMLHHGAFEVWGAGREPITDMKVSYWHPLPEVPQSIIEEQIKLLSQPS